MITDVLQANGFSDKQAEVYLAVLQLGEATVSRIADTARVKRTSVYDVLEELENMGVVSVTKKKGIQYASALSPRALVSRFHLACDRAEEALPQLMDMAYSSPLKPRMRFYDGISGLKDILKEMGVSSGATVGFTDYERMPNELFQFIRKEVVPERKLRKNEIRLLVPRNKRNEQVQKEDHLHYGAHKIINFPEQISHIEILLFDESKTGFLSFAENERFGVVIESPAIHNTLKNIFFLVWNFTEK